MTKGRREPGKLQQELMARRREVEQLRTLVKTGMVLTAKLSLKAVLQRIANMA